MSRPVRIGISACLLGERVRYDGGHKFDPYIVESLGQFFEWVPVCPEVELGLGTPRETIQLVKRGSEIRLLASETEVDLTDRMRHFAADRLARLRNENLSGYLLKSRSPSCGVGSVDVHHLGRVTPVGTGLFAEQLLRRFPNLPIAEESGLRDSVTRESWLQSVLAFHDLQELWRTEWTRSDLARFHARYELILRAHSEQHWRELGNLLHEPPGTADALREAFECGVMTALKKRASREDHLRVLRLALQLLQPYLGVDARAELAGSIADFASAQVPRGRTITLILEHAQRVHFEPVQQQVYLTPHPLLVAKCETTS